MPGGQIKGEVEEDLVVIGVWQETLQYWDPTLKEIKDTSGDLVRTGERRYLPARYLQSLDLQAFSWQRRSLQTFGLCRGRRLGLDGTYRETDQSAGRWVLGYGQTHRASNVLTAASLSVWSIRMLCVITPFPTLSSKSWRMSTGMILAGSTPSSVWYAFWDV